MGIKGGDEIIMDGRAITADDINEMSFLELDRNLAEILRHPDLWADIDPELLERIEPPEIVIHITGPRYDSSIGTGLMHQISRLQDKLNRFYALAAYNDPNFKLTEDEKAALEIFVKIEPGSSKLVLKCVKEFLRMVGRMKGWAQVTVILGLAGVFTFGYCFKTYNDRLIEQYKAAQETATITEMADVMRETNKLQLEMMKISSGLLSELAHVNGSVEINGESVSKTELAEYAKAKREDAQELSKPAREPYSDRIDGKFILEGITMSLDTENNLPKSISFRDISSDQTITYKPNYEKMSQAEEEFLASCVKGDIVEIEMIAFYDGNDNIQNVHLLKWNGKELEEPDMLE